MAKFTSQEVGALQEGGNQVKDNLVLKVVLDVLPVLLMFCVSEVEVCSIWYLQRAKEIYFKEWDPQRHSLPDGR